MTPLSADSTRRFNRSFEWSSPFPDRRTRPSCGVLVKVICTIVIVWVGLSAEAQNSPASAPTPPGALLDVGGYRIHIYCTGSGSPAVMIVGAAFSFDWDLVQSSVARFTRVCTFDPSGTAWSEPFQNAARVLGPNAPPHPTPTCADRVAEIHRVITSAPADGPYILVGYSVGALWERLYDARYPAGIVGMIIVDHIFLPGGKTAERQHTSAPALSGGYEKPDLITQAPLAFGFEDDVNFGKLPKQDQELHKWALAQHPVRPDEGMIEECLSQIDRTIGNRQYPLGNMPLTVIRTENESSGYAELQAKLLSLSRRSHQVVAWNSSHMVPIDDPEAIVSAIQEMVETTRGHKNEDERH